MMTQDQLMAQLRIIIPALGTIVTAFGVGTASVNNAVGIAMASVGPISYIIMAIWSLYANTQKAQIANVQQIAQGPASLNAVNAQTALIAATNAIAQDPTIPQANAAKQALIAATISLPEVQTIVTDKKTALASPSPNVVSSVS